MAQIFLDSEFQYGLSRRQYVYDMFQPLASETRIQAEFHHQSFSCPLLVRRHMQAMPA